MQTLKVFTPIEPGWNQQGCESGWLDRSVLGGYQCIHALIKYKIVCLQWTGAMLTALLFKRRVSPASTTSAGKAPKLSWGLGVSMAT